MLTYSGHGRTVFPQSDRRFPSVVDPAKDQLASERTKKALIEFLTLPALSAHGLLLKLRLALDYGEYITDAIDMTNRLVVPRALVAILNDLEHLNAHYRFINLEDLPPH